MVKVKICGITNSEDALKAAAFGAWALGFIFYKKSPRYVSPFKAKKIIDALPPFITPVGVFVNQNERAVRDIVDFCGISTVQFQGEETPLYCSRFKNHKVIKAFRVTEQLSESDLQVYRNAAYLFDTYQEGLYGGSGKTFNWALLKGLKVQKPVILSGGLNPQNVVEAVRSVGPYAVDVSSGVEESPGKKSGTLLNEFFKSLKEFAGQ